VIEKHNVTTEEEEVYNYTFGDLENAPAGVYTVQYNDNTTTRSVVVEKGNAFANDWLIVSPNPFRNNLNIYFKAPDAGDVSFRLVDAKGSTVAVNNTTVASGERRNIQFTTNNLAAGIYFLQYRSSNQKRVIKLMKY